MRVFYNDQVIEADFSKAVSCSILQDLISFFTVSRTPLLVASSQLKGCHNFSPYFNGCFHGIPKFFSLLVLLLLTGGEVVVQLLLGCANADDTVSPWIWNKLPYFV